MTEILSVLPAFKEALSNSTAALLEFSACKIISTEVSSSITSQTFFLKNPTPKLKSHK